MKSDRNTESGQVVPASNSECGSGARPELPALRILLADDNVVNRSFAQMILERDGHSVTSVLNGKEALEALCGGGCYDLVLMDVSMPVLDGLEATRCIRCPEEGAVELDKDIPIIAMTAHSAKGDRQRFLDAGMDDYVAKPLDWDELTFVMLRVMKAKGRQPSGS